MLPVGMAEAQLRAEAAQDVGHMQSADCAAALEGALGLLLQKLVDGLEAALDVLCFGGACHPHNLLESACGHARNCWGRMQK